MTIKKLDLVGISHPRYPHWRSKKGRDPLGCSTSGRVIFKHAPFPNPVPHIQLSGASGLSCCLPCVMWLHAQHLHPGWVYTLQSQDNPLSHYCSESNDVNLGLISYISKTHRDLFCPSETFQTWCHCLRKDLCPLARESVSQWPKLASLYHPSGLQDKNLPSCLSRILAAGLWVGTSLPFPCFYRTVLAPNALCCVWAEHLCSLTHAISTQALPLLTADQTSHRSTWSELPRRPV